MRRTLRFVLASLVLAASLLAQQPVARVDGRVLGPDGLPMPNVEVLAKARYQDDAILAKTRSDGDGMFVISRMPDDRGLSITAQAPGHTLSVAWAELSPEQPFAGVELRLYEANTLRGRIVDPEGRPVAGASVLGCKDMTWFHGQTMPVETTSDADGRFELRGVPIGDCVVRAYASGFALREYWLTALVDSEIEMPPLLREDGTTLSIAVAGLSPEEAAKTSLYLYPTRHGTGFKVPKCLERAVLAADGPCRLAGLPDAEWHVEPTLPGVTFDPRSATTKLGERAPKVQFKITRDGSTVIRGRVTDAAGKPLANQTMVCRTQRSQSMNGGRPGRATTDADGRFALDAPLVVGEPYSLHLVGSDYAFQQTKTKGMWGSSDPRYLVRWEDVADPVRELALVAVPVAKLTVTVRNGNQQPVPFLWLELQIDRGPFQLSDLAYATTSRDGVASFPGVHGTDVDVVVMGSGPAGAGRSAPFRLVAGEHQRLELVATAPGRIEGLVTDGGGKPLAGVRVSLRNVDAATGKQTDGSWSNVPTDRRGRFVFTGVAAGGHRVDIGLHAKTDGQAMSEPFEVAPGGKVQVELKVER
ncbi:MAG: carboxypeptidase regulatory-like domain-containing protein [Planctomycetota bacterium]